MENCIENRWALTELSSGHKYTHVEDDSVERLLLLDGDIMEQGGGFWVKISAKIVPKSIGKPHGIDYALCLYNSEGGRVLCYDNAHPISVGSGPSTSRTAVNDHMHKGEQVKPYGYTNADTLLQDFWTDVDAFLKKEGVP